MPSLPPQMACYVCGTFKKKPKSAITKGIPKQSQQCVSKISIIEDFYCLYINFYYFFHLKAW